MMETLEREGFIPIITRNLSLRLELDDTVMILRNNRKLIFYSDEDTYEMYEKMDNIREYLDERFYFCMNGCVINFDKVRLMAQGTVSFINGHDFNLSRDVFIRTRQTFNRYLRDGKRGQEKLN